MTSLLSRAGVVLAVLLATACSPTGEAPVKPAVADIRLGSFLPITGPYAEIGQSDHQAQLMAVAEINAAGGVLGRRLVLQSLDGGCDPAQTVAAVQQLIRDRIDVSVGGICSSSVISALPILRQANLVHIEPAANSSDLLTNPYSGLFLMMGTVADEAEAAGPRLDDLRIRRPVIVNDGTSFSFTLARSARSEFAGSAHPSVDSLSLTQGARTYAPVVKKIMASSADSVFFTGYYAEAGTLIRDLRAGGFHGPVVVGDGSADLAIIGYAGTRNLAKVYFVSPPLPETTPSAREWIADYRAFTGSSPRAFSMQSYAAVKTVAAAISRAGSTDSTALTKALRTTRVKTPYGKLRFDRRQVASTGFQLLRISDGKFTLACPRKCA